MAQEKNLSRNVPSSTSALASHLVANPSDSPSKTHLLNTYFSPTQGPRAVIQQELIEQLPTCLLPPLLLGYNACFPRPKD